MHKQWLFVKPNGINQINRGLPSAVVTVSSSLGSMFASPPTSARKSVSKSFGKNGPRMSHSVMYSPLIACVCAFAGEISPHKMKSIKIMIKILLLMNVSFSDLGSRVLSQPGVNGCLPEGETLYFLQQF